MTLEQQRIAILKEMGWTETESWLDGRRCFERADSNSGWNFDDLPDYLNDLNAMHEAEKMLYRDPNSPKKYTQQIKAAICREAGVKKTKMDFDVCITATAAQRAEAFLRTINKWTTNQPTKP